MSFKTLVSCEGLARRLDDPDWAIVDCRFSLGDTEKGRSAYRGAHIPGAIYAHLDDDLAGPIVPGKTGRHPLPDAEAFRRTLSGWGIDGKVQVVAYDDMGGAIASRLWWMLRWLGHDAVAVLNGGWDHWTRGDHPIHVDGPQQRTPRTFRGESKTEMVASTEDVVSCLADPAWRLIDSRVSERYRGEHEPIDPVAGRIPGAINAPHVDSVGADGLYLPPEQLRDHFLQVLGDSPPDRAVFYCGSGVTAARNLLAFAHAGLTSARMYPGSWSEWIADPSRPIETG